jgi:hypothetical protein
MDKRNGKVKPTVKVTMLLTISMEMEPHTKEQNID